MTDIDTDDTGFHLFANFDLKLGELTDEVKRLRREQARLAAQPNIVTLEQMAQPGAASSFFVDMGSPPDGRTWIVRLLVAIEATSLSANATVTTWYVGQKVNGPTGMLVPTSIRWQLPAIPAGGVSQQGFSSNIIQIQPKQHLLAGLNGVPASSSIALVAAVNDLPFHGLLSVVSGD